MDKPEIDIILPYWGEFSLLKKTVESVIEQTVDNWRLLVFDDHYPSDEAEKYFKTIKDKRISYYRHSKNIGITKNFNYALNAATAKYCVILGCDDMLLPNYLETALKNISKADFYQPGVQVIDKNDKPYYPMPDRIKNLLRPNKSGIYEGEKIASSLCMGNWLYFPSIVWKTKLIQKYGFDTEHNDTQDVILELTIIKNGARLFLDNEVTFQYRRSADSWSSQRKAKVGGRFTDENEVYTNFAKEFENKNWNKASRSARLHITSRIHHLLTKIQS